MEKGKRVCRFIGLLLLFIGINVAGRMLSSTFQLPVWMDMVGTCLGIYYLGPWGGILAGVANNVIAGLSDPMAYIYALTSLVAAIAMWICVRQKFMDELARAVGSSIAIGLICVIVSTPLNLLFYDGYSGNFWGDALTDMLLWNGYPRIIGAIAGEVIVEVVDKQICVLLAFLVIRIGKRLGKGRKVTGALLLALLVGGQSLLAVPLTARAADSLGVLPNYMGQVYNNTNGMISSEANAIAGTPDGLLWIGGYSGLTRYDGKSFEFIQNAGITSVTALLTDNQGRLWIGTSDRGVLRYEQQQYIALGEEKGFEGKYVHSFAQSPDGTMYVGTAEGLYAVDDRDSVRRINEVGGIVMSMACYQGMVVGVDHKGILFVYGNGGVSYPQGNHRVSYSCVALTSQGLLAGTLEGELRMVTLRDGQPVTRRYNSQTYDAITCICEDQEGYLWVCGDNLLGYLDKNGILHSQITRGFDSSMEQVYLDYQGNLWVPSSRYGVLKLSRSQFQDLFEQAGVSQAVTNTVVRYEGKLYCGTDNGLVILREDGSGWVENELTQLLDGDRVRCLKVDSRDRLWICTYGPSGLVCYDRDGTITTYHTGNSQVTGNRFRCILELRDGSFAVGASNGLNLIRDGRVVKTLTEEDGLENTQILSLLEREDGVLYVGTDGAGIYLLREGEIIGHYTTDDGLSSKVILRMVPCTGGVLVVTGNALCYISQQGIRVLDQFPYYNNYDVMIDGKTVYVLSSAGIFTVDEKKLLSEEGNLPYRQLSVAEGLPMGLTSNSWNQIEDGILYICGNNGVIAYHGYVDESEKNFLFGISSVDCDGEMYYPQDNTIQIPAGTHRVSIAASVRNYLLLNVKARIYVEGVDTRPKLVDYDKLEPLVFTDLPCGSYRIRFQVYDSTGTNILEEKVYTMVREPQVWENTWYRIYLGIVCVEMIAFLSWTVFLLRNMFKRKNQLETLRRELQSQLEQKMEEVVSQREQAEQLLYQVVQALSSTVDAKDHYTSGHSRRVAAYSRQIAEKMGKTTEEQQIIYYAGLLHDVGKIRVPDEIINKPGKLDQKEFDFIRLHPVAGYHILKDISGNRKFSEGARFHHERYDGTGYPNGLKGNNIPEIARIIGVADAYDAMASNRSYRQALPQEVVRGEIEKGKGTQFDPEIADIMLGLIDEDKEYHMCEQTDGQKFILVVDDEPTNSKMVRFIMREESKYQILTACNARETMEILADHQVDMLLLDIEMPQMDGFQLLELIREKYQIPVVFMTGNKDLETIQKAEAVGVEDYITKPIFPLALKEVVYSTLVK